MSRNFSYTLRFYLLAFVFLNCVALAQVIPNDPSFLPNQWALRDTGQNGGTPGADIRASLAWAITEGDTNVVLVILDSGIPSRYP